MLNIGLIINPVAGMGGSVALKGSDNVIDEAIALGAKAKSNDRARIALNALIPYQLDVHIITSPLNIDCYLIRGIKNRFIDDQFSAIFRDYFLTNYILATNDYISTISRYKE